MRAAVLALLLTLPARASSPDRPVNLWPLFTRQPLSDGVETEALFWLYHHRRDGAVSVTSVRPLFRHETTPEFLASRLFPLYDYRGEKDRWDLGVGGLTPFTAASFSADDAREDYRSRVLFWRKESEPGRRLLELPPLWAASDSKDGARHRSALGLPDTMNLFESRLEPSRSRREWHALTVWRMTSPGEEWLHVWPFYGRRRAGTLDERSTLWPMAVTAADPARGYALLRLWPLYEGSRADSADAPADLGLNMALPLPLVYRARAGERSYRRLLYLHWLADTPQRRVHVTPPWYSFTDKAQGATHRGLFPFYHGARRRGRALDVAAPLYVSWKDEDFLFRTLFPFYWRVKDGDAESLYFFPVYGQTAKAGAVTRRLLLFPLYARKKEPFELDLLWPLVHVSSSSTRLLPLWWSGRSGSDSFAVAPLYARFTRGEETRSALFPLYWRMSAPGRDYRSFVPLGGAARDGDERDRFALGFTPSLSLFESRRSPGTAMDRALLLYRSRGPGESTGAFFPFYFRWEDAGERGLVLFPFYSGYDDRSSGLRRRAWLGFWGGFSLFETLDDPANETRSVRALLYARKRSGKNESTVLAPVYWRFASPASTRTFVLPLYASRVEGARVERGFLGFSPRWSLLSVRRSPEGSETRFFWRLVRVLRGKDASATELNPLFFSQREGKRRYSAVLGGLVGWEEDESGGRWRWLWVL